MPTYHLHSTNFNNGYVSQINNLQNKYHRSKQKRLEKKV